MPRKKINKYNPVAAYVPIAFPKIEELLTGTNLSPDRMRAILHQFYAARLLETANEDKRDSDLYRAGYVIVSSVFLKVAGTDDYKKYLDFLEQKKLVVPKRNTSGNKSYIRNSFCTAYKITPKLLISHISNRHYREETIRCQRVLKSIHLLSKKFRERIQPKNHLPFDSIHEQIIDMLKTARFDMQAADEYIGKIKLGEIKLKDEKKKNRPYGDWLELIAAFNRGEYTCVRDKFGERLHTPITNLWRELRQFLYFEDAPETKLVEVDIANSQPFFSGMCTHPHIIENLIPEFSFCTNALRLYEAHESIQLYEYYTRTGKLYNYWMNARGLGRDRDAAKEDFIALMYNRKRPRSVAARQAKLIFKINFPMMDWIFDYIKSLSENELPFMKDVYIDQYGRFGGRKYYFKNLSAAMQRCESRVFLQKICPSLIENGIRFITIHDGILVEPEHSQKACKLMEDEFQKLGIQPPLIRIKPLE